MRPAPAVLICLCLAACLGPAPVKRDRITALLEGRTVIFEEDPAAVSAAEQRRQVWRADGTTTRHNMGIFGADIEAAGPRATIFTAR
jgi:hypothetical protein